MITSQSGHLISFRIISILGAQSRFYISGHYECDSSEWKKCLPIVRKQEDLWENRLESLRNDISQLDSKRVSEFEGESGSGPKYFKNRVGLNVWTSEPIPDKIKALKIKYMDILDSIIPITNNKFRMTFLTKSKNNLKGLIESFCENPDYENEPK